MPTTHAHELSANQECQVTGRALTLALALGLGTGLAGCSRAPKHPNVLLISIEMLRADHLACYGYSRPTSPGIDRLAAEGVLFEQHLSSSSWSLPAHASLFTSVPDSVHGAFDAQHKLPEAAHTLAERFRAGGYRTAGFFSGPYLHPAFGLGQGFEHYENCASYRSKLEGQPVAAWAADPELLRAAHEDLSNPAVFSAFQRWFQKRSDEPFFAFVHLSDAHFDFRPPPPHDQQADPSYTGSVTGKRFLADPLIGPGLPERDKQHLVALYDSEIAWTDAAVILLRAALERAGELKNTVIAVTSDHGVEFFEHGGKGCRMTLYDELIRVPLVLRAPERLPKNVRVRALTASIDVGPTLLELAGLPPATAILGTSLVPLAHDPAAPHARRAVSELVSAGRNMRAVRGLEFKLVDDVGAGTHYYFDLRQDPREQTKLTDFSTELGRRAESAYAAEVQRIEALLNAHPPVEELSGAPPEAETRLSELGYVAAELHAPQKRPDAPVK